MVYCEHCDEAVAYPFKCHYCQGIFCQKCRLPENHQCTHLELVRSQRKEILSSPRTRPPRIKDAPGMIRIPRQRSPRGWFERILTGPPSDFGRREPWRLMGGTTTGNEALDILVAAALIFGVLSFRNLVFPSFSGDRSYLAGILLTIMTGFIGHELAHRSIARRNGLNARFVLWTQGIMLTLLGLVLPFVFIVPGFVFMIGYATRTVSGKVALSGPFINVVNGLVFLVLWLMTDVALWGFQLDTVLHLAAQLNFFLALFNLIPLGPLDGRKVREWNPIIWAMSLGSSLLLWLVVLIL